MNRYLTSDRNNLVFNEDGSLDILIQATAPDDAAMYNNWLPVNEGSFHVVLRICLPSKSVLDGSWQAPAITRR